MAARVQGKLGDILNKIAEILSEAGESGREAEGLKLLASRVSRSELGTFEIGVSRSGVVSKPEKVKDPNSEEE